jgi:membrane-anchored protein YejM (alkaline phosphatase superfamily)
LLDAWSSAGLSDDSIIVFTADHGEAMIEGNRYFSHGFDVSEPVMRVPLVVRRPGGKARRHATPVSTVDIVPSILEWAGLPPLSKADGLVLGSRGANDPISLEATTRNRQLRAVIAGDRKWLVARDRTGRTINRSNTRISEQGTLAAEVGWPEGAGREALIEWIAEDRFPEDVVTKANPGEALKGPKVAPGRTDEQIEALKALGYVE